MWNTIHVECTIVLFINLEIANSSGEPACIAVTEEISAGQSLHPCLFGNVLPACAIRKNDAIIAIQQSKERVEFSINEWKKNNASTTTAIKQQSRRLRSNLSILYQSKRKLNIQIKDILAIDFVCKYSWILFYYFQDLLVLTTMNI